MSQDRDLRRAGVIAGFLALGCTGAQIAIEVTAVGFLGIPVPASVEGWLQDLNDHRLIAIVELTVLQIPTFALLAVVLLALRTTLNDTASALVSLSTLSALIGVVVYLSSNAAFGLASLSDAYAAATDAGTRASVVAAARALLAAYEGIGVDVGSVLILLGVGGFSLAMWRADGWHRAVPKLGAAAVAISSVYYVAIPLGQSRIFILELGSGVFLAWLLGVTLGLWRRAWPAARQTPSSRGR